MAAPTIDGYRFGQMTVDGTTHTQDLILLPERVVENWRRGESHRLDTNDLQAVFDAGPEVLVVGTGAYGRVKIPAETRRALETAGIELQAARTGEAWRRYNGLRGQRRTAAAFHLTC